MTTALTSRHRSALRARAHNMKPIVLVGQGGLSRGVLDELARALDDHELVKLRFHHGDRASIRDEIDSACSALNATLIQRVGKTAVIFRARLDGAQRGSAQALNRS